MFLIKHLLESVLIAIAFISLLMALMFSSVRMIAVSMLPNITYELLKRGYSEKDIRKILGENFLRAFAEAERVSRGMSKSISGEGSLRRISQ